MTCAPMCSNVGSTSDSETTPGLNSLHRSVPTWSDRGRYRLMIGPLPTPSSSILSMSETAKRAGQSAR